VDRIFKKIKFYGIKSTKDTPYCFFADLKENLTDIKESQKSGCFYEYPCICWSAFSKVSNYILLQRVDNEGSSEFKNKGLASALTMLRLLYIFSSFDFTHVKTARIENNRVGLMYTNLGMTWTKNCKFLEIT